jgi:DNA-binding NtrC family response regulator
VTTARPRILLADDDPTFRLALGKALSRQGFAIEEAATGAEAVAALREGHLAAALLDLQLGDLDGLEVLRQARGTPTKVVVVTGHGTIAAAVEAMRLGAVSFVQKPVDAPALLPLLADALREGACARAAPAAGDLGMAGESPAMERVRDMVRRFGPTGEPVLVLGESGVGKELVARALHAESPRSRGPFVALNCAQARGDLFDAELFGHVKGSFTGAVGDRPGLMKEADGGTLFLDEVGELPEPAQAKLLRALETGAIRPVGGVREEPVDVRIVAATNRDLAQLVGEGRFRKDLLFRLHVLAVAVPPLRERKQDLAPIAAALLARISCARGRPLALAPGALEVLAAYDWPGNVRELFNVLKRAAAFADGEVLEPAALRDAVGTSIFGHPEARAAAPATPSAEVAELTLAELEKRHILETLDRLGGNITKVAVALGIDRRTLQRKLKALGRDEGDEA